MFDISLQFSSLADFLAMGKHGVYVWSAYGITLIIVVLNLVVPLLKRRDLLLEIKRNENRKQRHQEI